jgi:protein-disulfide isomerase
VALSARNLLLILGAVVVIAAAGIFYYVSRPESSAIPAGGTAETIPTDQLMVAGPLGDKALGDPNAKVTVIEYASMTCPHCAHFHETTFTPFKEKYVDTGKVRFIFREFPFDPVATAAFMLARCAPADSYFPMVDLLFRQQKNWAYGDKPTDALFNIVKQAGFTQESFRACLTNQQILDGVNDVKNRGADQLGVSATPTFFINGKKFSGALSLEELDQEIEPLLPTS